MKVQTFSRSILAFQSSRELSSLCATLLRRHESLIEYSRLYSRWRTPWILIRVQYLFKGTKGDNTKDNEPPSSFAYLQSAGNSGLTDREVWKQWKRTQQSRNCPIHPSNCSFAQICPYFLFRSNPFLIPRHGLDCFLLPSSMDARERKIVPLFMRFSLTIKKGLIRWGKVYCK